MEAFGPWLEEVLQEKAIVRDEHREVVSRLKRVERGVSELKAQVRDLRREMNERMFAQNLWLVGSIALFGTVISIILGIGQLVKLPYAVFITGVSSYRLCNILLVNVVTSRTRSVGDARRKSLDTLWYSVHII